MLTLLHKYDRVRKYWLIDSGIITESNKEFRFPQPGLSMQFNARYPTIRYSSATQIGIYNHPDLLLIDRTNYDIKDTISIPEGLTLYEMQETHFVCMRRVNDDLKQVVVLDRNRNVVNESIALPVWLPYFTNGRIIYTTETTARHLSGYSFQENKELFSIDMKRLTNTEDAHLSGEVYIQDDRAIFCISNSYGTDYATFILDINTGEIIEKIALFRSTYLYDGKIYDVDQREFKCYDISSRELIRYNLTSLFAADNLVMTGSPYVIFENKLYFSAVPEGNSLISGYIGIINLITWQLEWRYELLIEPEKGSFIDNRYSVTSMQVNNNLLAIHCAGNTLFVFDKNNTTPQYS